MSTLIIVLCLLFSNSDSYCDTQYGPDPWNCIEDANKASSINSIDVPPDLKYLATKERSSNNLIPSEWFYKRLLALVLKGGKVKNDNNNNVDIILQMHFPKDKWSTLSEYLATNDALSEDMYRRSIGYIQDAILKPTVTEHLAMAWTEYIYYYAVHYKMHIMWVAGSLGAILFSMYIWNHMSHKLVFIVIFAAIYMYEVFVSYKEAEQQEYEKFVSSINTCKWYFWFSTCDVPPPDPLIFIKHMHPLKIGMRIFATIFSEPMITFSSTLNTIVQGMTDGLWYPLNKIMFCILTVIFNVLLIAFLIGLALVLLYNYVLNIPFKMNFLPGFLSIDVKQRNRQETTTQNNTLPVELGDRISGANLDKLFNFYAYALKRNDSPRSFKKIKFNNNNRDNRNKDSLKRSASTGRLPDTIQALVPSDKGIKKWFKRNRKIESGGGDCK